MNEKVKAFVKNPKFLVIVGISGILLIFISSIFEKDNTGIQKAEPFAASCTAEQYAQRLEESIKDIVQGITGDKNSTVVVTLESGIRYSYVSADETDVSSVLGQSTDQSSESKKESYITVKTADGGEQALIATEIMPEIRGVAIICKGGNDELVAEKIKNAVISALNITSKRVYISGGVHK